MTTAGTPDHSTAEFETTFHVPKMDCPSEERLIRMALQPEVAVRQVRVEIEARRVVVRHEGDNVGVLARLEALGLGARVVHTEQAAATPRSEPLARSTFEIPKMDCPSEERLIRMALEPESGVRELSFDLAGRTLAVVHEGPGERVLARLEPLGLGARLTVTEAATPPKAADSDADDAAESRVLKILFGINAAMFVVELIIGLVAQSTGLVADSVDMFADAAVYSVALYGVGRSAVHKQRSARISGVLQLVLALGVLAEVGRRAVYGSDPVGPLMMGVSLVALAANVSCLALLSKHRTGGVHMKASWIFSTNDVIANLGVIAAGALVAWTGSALPDLLIGSIIGLIVLTGAARIWRIAR